MNNLSDNWIQSVMDRRAKLEVAPDPFATPELFDSIVYLFGELAEFGAALHKTTRNGDLRNPNSKRGGVAEEMGDSLFMLGTVAHQAGHEHLFTYNYHTGLFYDAVVSPTNRDMIDAYMVTQSLAQELYDELDENGVFPSMAATTDILNDLYSNLETLAHWLGIDMAGALDSTIKKLEERAGL